VGLTRLEQDEVVRGLTQHDESGVGQQAVLDPGQQRTHPAGIYADGDGKYGLQGDR
jgi:hypothetical protein